MEKIFHRIVSLFHRSLEAPLTGAEQAELERLVAENNLRELLNEWENGTLLGESFQESAGYSAEQGFAGFEQRLQQRHVEHRRFLNRRLLGWSSAAAVVLVAALAAVGVFRYGAVPAPDQLAGVQEVVLPARNQSRLRLANGEERWVSDTVNLYRPAVAVSVEGAGTGEADIAENELIVPPGGECFVILADGSKVWLNADSRLTYPVCFAGSLREVRLQGEAFFDVTPQEAPFIVQTERGNIRVLGTSFCISAYPQETLTATLVTGRIRYSHTTEIDLHPGEQVRAPESGEAEKRVVDVDEYIGWKTGKYVFYNRPLESIMKDLARWYDLTVSYDTPELREMLFSGDLERYDTINKFLDLLENTGDLRYTIRERHVTLYGGARSQ